MEKKKGNIKKAIKILISVIVFCLLIFICYKLYTAKIIYDIYGTLQEKANEDNFYVKKTFQYEDGHTTTLETYIKNGVYVKHYKATLKDGNERKLTFWEKNEPEKEKNKYYLIIQVNNETPYVKIDEVPSKQEVQNGYYKYDFASSLVIGDGELYFYEYEPVSFCKILKYCFTEKLRVSSTKYNEQDVYLIKAYENVKYYIGKESKLPIAQEFGDQKSIQEYFTKEVTEEDIKEPDVTAYKIQENH